MPLRKPVMVRYTPPSQKLLKFLAFTLYFFLSLFRLYSQPILEFNPVITGLSSPMQAVHAGDGSGRLFIVQKGGTIRVFDQSYNDLGTFLTVTGISTTGERGLLSLVFHPLFEDNGLFFVYYTNTGGDLELARCTVSDNPDQADPLSRVIVLTIPHPGQTNHNGGEMHFGTDGLLYLSTGDGGGSGDPSNNAQNTSVLLGKMLRIAVNESDEAPFYTIPPGNPFANEIFDLGLRNPFRWSFDRETGDIWIGDVGQDSWEEINYRAAALPAGVNYGWRCYEGNEDFNLDDCGAMGDYTFPAHAYTTQDPAAAITGGVVYRGSDINLRGYYVSADFYSGRLYKIIPDGSGGWITYTQDMAPTGISDFGETEDGEVFAVSLTAGNIYSVSVSSVVPVILSDFTVTRADDGANLEWSTSTEQHLDYFEIEYSTDGTNFTRVDELPAANSADGATYEFTHTHAHEGMTFYRLRMVDIDGTARYSEIVSLPGKDETRKSFVNPSVIRGNSMNLFLEVPYNTFEMVNTAGIVVQTRQISGRTGRLELNISYVPPGVYMVRLRNNTHVISQKVIVR